MQKDRHLQCSKLALCQMNRQKSRKRLLPGKPPVRSIGSLLRAGRASGFAIGRQRYVTSCVTCLDLSIYTCRNTIDNKEIHRQGRTRHSPPALILLTQTNTSGCPIAPGRRLVRKHAYHHPARKRQSRPREYDCLTRGEYYPACARSPPGRLRKGPARGACEVRCQSF